MMEDMTPEEVGRRAKLAFIQAARKAVALAEATNTLVIAKGFDEVPEPRASGDIAPLRNGNQNEHSIGS